MQITAHLPLRTHTAAARTGLGLRTVARFAGALYLIVAVCGGFSELTRVGALVAGDPGRTAANIRAATTTLRLALATDLIDVVAFVATALALYVLLAPTTRRAAATFVLLNAISVAVMSANLVSHAAALIVATDPTYTQAFGAATADGVALLFLDLHRIGYLIAQIFFGLWLAPLGYAVYRSGYFPRALGVVLVIGCLGYGGDVAASVASPTLTSALTAYLALPAGLAELAFALWLLVMGANVSSQLHEGA